MVKHVVMFKLIPFETEEAKQNKLEEIKTSLEALKDKIEVLHHIQVDFNCNPAETWDLILTTELDSLEAVSIYANHPAHVAISKDLIGPVKADRACVDCEY